MATSSTNKQFGGIAEYDSEREDRSIYVERIELFLIANNIIDKAKKALLLNCCGIAIYRTFKGLTALPKPAKKKC